jgi:hypothetical protein
MPILRWPAVEAPASAPFEAAWGVCSRRGCTRRSGLAPALTAGLGQPRPRSYLERQGRQSERLQIVAPALGSTA